MTRYASALGRACLATFCLMAYAACDQGEEDRDLLEDLDRGDGDECPIAGDLVAFQKARFNFSTKDYEIGHEVIGLKDAPSDMNVNAWAALHDGSDEYVYYMNTARNALHQFKYTEADNDDRYPGLGGLGGLGGFALPSYEFQRTIPFTGYPGDADKSSFAMLHDGGATRLYFLNNGKNQLIQGAFNSANNRFEFGHNSIERINITGIPGDADFRGWGMLHAGSHYSLYSLAKDNSGPDDLYQFGWNGSSYHLGGKDTDGDGVGDDLIKEIDLTGHDDYTVHGDFAMMHGDGDYQLLIPADLPVLEVPGFGDGFPGCPPGEPFCFE